MQQLNDLLQSKKTLVAGILIVLLFAITIFLAISWIEVKIELKNKEASFRFQQTNEKIVSFTRLFIAKVLKKKEEVTLAERLQLENAILDLKDEEIATIWTNFKNSKTDKEAQKNVTDLLEILMNKIEIN